MKALKRCGQIIVASIEAIWRAWKRRLILHHPPRRPKLFQMLINADEIHLSMGLDPKFDLERINRQYNEACKEKDPQRIAEFSGYIFECLELTSRRLFLKRVNEFSKHFKGVFFAFLLVGVVGAIASSANVMIACIRMFRQ